jgi:hypothetical protein
VNRPTAKVVAWGACALTLVLAAVIIFMILVNGDDVYDANFTIVAVSSAIVGAVVASRRPTNPVGWLFLGGVLGAAIKVLAGEYAVYGISTNPGAVPLPYVMAWISNTMIWIGPVISFILIPLYFPDGRPVSRRWSIVARVTLGSLILLTAFFAIAPGEVMDGSGIRNPLGLEALRPFMPAIYSTVTVWYIALILAAAASLVVRFLRSVGEERQQLKWFTYAASFIPVWFLVNAPIQASFPRLFAVLDGIFIAAVPVAAGLAILRYRLYDIDIIINRTLVYGVLTLLLGVIYFGAVVVLQRALVFTTGERSTLAVVASTLAIAALFNPLRHTIQSFIDRRFYRSRYDARKTLEAFSARLRDETDLDALSGELVSVVHAPMHPHHASLWLKPPDGLERSERGSRGV